MKLKTLEQIVLETLTEQPETQKDDFILILKVYEKLTDKDTMGQSFSVLMTYHNDFGLPPFESVRRCRQKIQAKHPELVDPSTAKHRHKLIDEYKEYAKDKAGDPKPKQAKLIRDNGYFFEVGETIDLIEKNDMMGLFTNGKNTCWIYLTDIEWIGE
jgi:hypothetical protein